MLTVRLRAWLSATPEGAKQSRIKSLIDRGEELPAMPSVHEGMAYLLDWLDSAGVCEVGFSGLMPLSWRELAAWRDGAAMPADDLDMMLLRDMSAAYCEEASKAKQPNAVIPYLPDDERLEERKAKASDGLTELLRRRAKNNRRR